MTVREFDRAVLSGHTVVAMVPTTDNYQWAGSQAWSIARNAAGHGSSVVLVDLFVEHQVLESESVESTEEGIVDAFLYDVSLNHVARPQGSSDLHYIGVGTQTHDGPQIWSHPRWNRLARGFANEGALLLLFVPPHAVPHMSVLPDGLILLQSNVPGEPGPAPLGSTSWSEVPVLGTLAPGQPTRSSESAGSAMRANGKPPEAAVAEPVPPRPDRSVRQPAGWRSPMRKSVGGGVLVIVLLGLWEVLRRQGMGGSDTVAPAFAVASPQAEAATSMESSGGDSLFYSVQVAAVSTWGRAWEYASALERTRLVAAVTPIRVGRRVWYRVLVGALSTPSSGRDLLSTFWQDGLVEAGQGTILRTPHAFDLGSRENADLAREEARRLRDRGIPAYSLETSIGVAHILVGAFETANQTAVAESILTAAGLPATLITRTGITP